MAMYDENYGTAPVLQDISRQRKLADQLRAQSEEPLNGQMVSGIYVAPSWSQYLAKGLKSYMAGDTERNANKKEADYAKTKAQKIADFLKGNQAQTTQQGTTDTSVIPAFTPEQQDRFGSPLQGVQRQSVVTSTPNMVTESPDQVQARQRATAYQLASEYGNDPSVQLALQDLNHQRDRGEQVGDRKDQWAHEDINHVRDIGDQRQNMAIQNQYSVDNQGRVFAHDDTTNAANHAFTTSERLGSQGFQAGQNTLNRNAENYRSQLVNNRLSGDEGAIENNAKMIANGQLPPLTGNSLRTPIGMKTMARVLEMKPDYQGADYSTAAKAQKDFGSGKLGSTVRSFNVSIGHLDTLDKLTNALGNGNVQAINKISQEYAKQTGQAAPANFDAAKQIIGDEIVKAIVGSGGGVADREKAQEALSKANSPAQMTGVINTYKSLMKDQIAGFRHQYKSSTGKDDFDAKYLTPESTSLENGTNLAHPQDNEAVTWAKSNPNDPRSKAILQANGVK